MKQWIAALLLMLIPGVQAAKPQKVTLMVDDVPVAQVLQALAEQEKLNLVVSPDVSGRVEFYSNSTSFLLEIRTCKIETTARITKKRTALA